MTCISFIKHRSAIDRSHRSLHQKVPAYLEEKYDRSQPSITASESSSLSRKEERSITYQSIERTTSAIDRMIERSNRERK